MIVILKDGSAYFENIAQYLSGSYPQLSPKSVRKILQFEDINEFEGYLESKIARKEAYRISELSGDNLVDMEAMKRYLLCSSSSFYSEPPYYNHTNCEYDVLRNDNIYSIEGKSNKMTDSTKQVEIAGTLVKSTFVSLTPIGYVDRLPHEKRPISVSSATKDADYYENQKILKGHQFNLEPVKINQQKITSEATNTDSLNAKSYRQLLPIDEIIKSNLDYIETLTDIDKVF